ncbi:hypothetical protein [Rickettsia endosymbiont of Halotydeus destructor]|uniref:hypothetical protein n=1 Tax=Rickettsia endosymbiont of Halotydeus destructor TaxID=2996754 RepID=UPI003BAE6A61
MTSKGKVDTSYYDTIIETNDLSRMNEVLEYCDEKLKINPDDIAVLYRKSEALEALEEVDEAMNVLKKALSAVTKLVKEDEKEESSN